MLTIKKYGASGQKFIIELDFEHYENATKHLRFYQETLLDPRYQGELEQNTLKEIIKDQKKYISKLKIELDI